MLDKVVYLNPDMSDFTYILNLMKTFSKKTNCYKQSVMYGGDGLNRANVANMYVIIAIIVICVILVIIYVIQSGLSYYYNYYDDNYNYDYDSSSCMCPYYY